VLGTIEVPLLVLAGEHDVRSPVAVGAALAAAAPRGTLVVLENAAHMSNMEAPAEFNAALEAFLTDAGGRT
jgi:pimeloyl-ACP methyl ester carboxylesterase